MMCFCISLFPAEGFDVGRIDQSFSKQTADFFSIYHKVRRSLESYYNRQYFEDADRSSGWYRVDEFLEWVYKNEAKLKKSRVLLHKEYIPLSQLYISLQSEMHQKLFWGYLGARYAFEKMNLDGDLLEKYPFSICSENSCYATANLNSITLGQTERADFVGFFNIGIHEATHILPISSRRQGTQDALPESATVKAQNLWGLPVRAKKDFYSGVRDFRVSYRQGVSPQNLMTEYADAVPSVLYGKDVFKAKAHQSITFCNLLQQLQPPTPFYQLSEKYWIDPIKNESLLKEFFGSSKWAEAFRAVEKSGYVVLGRYEYQDIIPVYEQYFKQYWNDLADNPQLYQEQVKNNLSVFNTENSYKAFLYKNGKQMKFAFFPTNRFDMYFDDILMEHLSHSLEAFPFYKQLIGPFYKSGFSCEKTVTEAVELLDQMAGKDNVSVVPAGYI